MSTTISDIINRIIRLAKEFNESNDASIYFLLKQTGYIELHDQISIDLIRNALLDCPEYINYWIQFSEDKRSNVGWYIRRDETSYEVGFFDSKAPNICPEKYTDPAEACAIFIKHEIESIRQAQKHFNKV